jgi:hypothetical protein
MGSAQRCWTESVRRRSTVVLKPSIPEIGEHGIPIHDELEFELELS